MVTSLDPVNSFIVNSIVAMLIYSFNQCTICKILTIGEPRTMMYGNSLYELCYSSLNLKLFQN